MQNTSKVDFIPQIFKMLRNDRPIVLRLDLYDMYHQGGGTPNGDKVYMCHPGNS